MLADMRGSATLHRIVVYIGGFTLVALVLAAQIFLSLPGRPRPGDFSRILVFQLSGWYVWAALAPLVFLATRRWPIRSGCLWRSILAHAMLAAVFLFAKIWLDLAVARVLGAGPPAFPGPAGPPGAGDPGLLSKVVRGLGPNAVAYAAIVAVSHAVEFYRKYREREFASSRLEAQLARARLQVLEMQLRPHFLFNALNAIAALVRKEPELAEDMVVALSGLLRAILQRGGAQEVRLGEEVDLARMYLDIERIRFRDRLQVEVAIAAECEDVLVPSMILQPLAENAVRHGVARSSRAGRVILRAERDGERLVLTVEDDGPGLSPEGPEGVEEHVGLSNTRERLRQLHGDRQKLEISARPEGGTVVRLTLPAHRAGTASPGSPAEGDR